MTDAVFVSWIRHHGRSAALANELGIDAYFIAGGRGPAPLRYIRAWRETRRLLHSIAAQRGAALVMLPPTPALLAAASVRGTVRIAGDLHSGVFNDPKWSWALAPTLWILRKRGIAVVTNEALAQRCRARGVNAVVLHDPLETFSTEVPPLKTKGVRPNSYVLFPVTYARDEPINAVLDAARLAPELTFVLTGLAPEHIRIAAPSNVHFSGFVSEEDFLSLLRNAGAVGALTTRSQTMQRAAYEALSANVPLITSRTDVLAEYFGDAAVYAKPEAQSISAAAREAVAGREELRSRLADLKRTRIREQENALARIQEWLELAD